MHTTREKLKSTPFSSAKELDSARQELELEIWREIERAKVMHEQLKLEQNQFFLEVFRNPWRCCLNDKDGSIVSVHLSETNTPEVKVDRKLYEEKHRQEFIEGVIRAMLGEFTSEYLNTVKIKQHSGPGLKPNKEFQK